MKYGRSSSFLLVVVSLGVISCRGNHAVAALQRGTLEVWAPQVYFMWRVNAPTAQDTYTYEWATLLSEFKRDYPNFDLRFKILRRDDFVRAFHSSGKDPVYPDMAFLDDYSELGPLVNNDAVIMMAGRPRFRYKGWWAIFRATKNLDAARAFTLWLAQSPHWKPWKLATPAMPPQDAATVKAIAKEAVRDLEHQDTQSLSVLMDREASHFDWDFPPAKTLASVDPLVTFGNSRLAFVLSSPVSEGEKNLGTSHSALVLRKVEGQWKVLLILRQALPDLEDLLQSFDRLGLDDGPSEPPLTKVMLLRPADHAPIAGYPQRDLQWESLGSRAAAYVLEFQMGQLRREFWSTSFVVLMRAPPGQSSITKQIPLIGNAQPYRWRIWAIGGTGGVSTSDWRTIDFTN